MVNYRYYQFKLIPNKEQCKLLQQYIDSDKRFYNYLLNELNDNYTKSKKVLTELECNNRIDEFLKLKSTIDYNTVDKGIFKYTIKKVIQSFISELKDHQGIIEKLKYKNMKKQDGSFSIKLSTSSINAYKKSLSLYKIPNIKIIFTEKLDLSRFCGLTSIKLDKTGCYYACLLFTSESNKKIIIPKTFLGLDFSLDDLYVDSDGNKPNFIGYYTTTLDKIKKTQQKLDNTAYDSNNYKKLKLKLSKIYKNMDNKKKDFLHKESNRLAQNYDCIVVEDLDLSEMASGKYNHLRKQIDTSYNKFVQMLDYKLKALGKSLIKVDRYFPSSQLCSNCGYKNLDVKDLSIREWDCPKCGKHHNRDENAAINIREEGKKIALKKIYNR